MPLPPKIVLASHNREKIAEFQNMFAPFDVRIVGADVIGLPEPEETEETFEGNALLKARYACEITAMPCLADDSGLSVTALNGAPGVYSARWAGNNRDFNMAMNRVWTEMGTDMDRSAAFIAVLALVMPDGCEFIAHGKINGELCWPPRGRQGFGYDPIFIPERSTLTFAEMDMEEKGTYSHRARAFAKLVDQF